MPLIKGKSEGAFKHNLKAEIGAGKPTKQALAIAYATRRKAQHKAFGGEIEQEELESGYVDDLDKDDEEHMAKGGMTHGSLAGDIVDHIMDKRKKYSEGGKVANEGMDELSDMADSKPNEFDDLVLDDDLDFQETGANSGDELGNVKEDEDRKDIIQEVLRKRAKQKNLSPA